MVKELLVLAVPQQNTVTYAHGWAFHEKKIHGEHVSIRNVFTTRFYPERVRLVRYPFLRCTHRDRVCVHGRRIERKTAYVQPGRRRSAGVNQVVNFHPEGN